MTAHESPELDTGSPLVFDALDALQEGIQVLSPEWRYLYLNHAASQQGRKPRDQLLGRTMVECYPGIDATPMFSVLRRCMVERDSETMENEFMYEDGRRACFELRIRPCPAGIVIVSLDITERKDVEVRLRQAYDQAIQDLITPVLRVHPGMLLVPLVGALDGRRVSQITDTVLARTVEDHAKVVIFDVAGVPNLDTRVAHDLLQTAAMIRLLGATPILTGIVAAAAKTVIQLGVNLAAVQTTRHLADGIELALARIRHAT